MSEKSVYFAHPSPWKVSKDVRSMPGATAVIRDADGWSVAYMTEVNPERWAECIAALPDLLRAAEAALVLLDDLKGIEARIQRSSGVESLCTIGHYAKYHAERLGSAVRRARGEALQVRARYYLLTRNADGSDETMVDDDLDLGAFYAENDLDPEDVNAIGALDRECDHRMGGGAAPIFIVRRVQ